MLIRDIPIGHSYYTQLASTALAVLVRREDGWAVYAAGVPGVNHSEEWQDVKRHGDKQREAVARAIVTTLFYPAFDPGDLQYVA